MARVLIVDDEIDTLNLLRTILDLSGHQATTTLNSVDAITLAEIEQPDCILLDIMMPQLDGFTLCKMMRLHPATAHLPIVFVTAYSALDLEDRRKEAGADMVLPKPIGMDTLIEAVETAINMRHKPVGGHDTSMVAGMLPTPPAKAPAPSAPPPTGSTATPAKPAVPPPTTPTPLPAKPSTPPAASQTPTPTAPVLPATNQPQPSAAPAATTTSTSTPPPTPTATPAPTGTPTSPSTPGTTPTNPAPEKGKTKL